MPHIPLRLFPVLITHRERTNMQTASHRTLYSTLIIIICLRPMLAHPVAYPVAYTTTNSPLVSD